MIFGCVITNSNVLNWFIEFFIDRFCLFIVLIELFICIISLVCGSDSLSVVLPGILSNMPQLGMNHFSFPYKIFGTKAVIGFHLVLEKLRFNEILY